MTRETIIFIYNSDNLFHTFKTMKEIIFSEKNIKFLCANMRKQVVIHTVREKYPKCGGYLTIEIESLLYAYL